jgi:hypothetical protein
LLEARISETSAELEKRTAEFQQVLESERHRLGAESQMALMAERARHDNELSEILARSEENARLLEQLRADMISMTQSPSELEHESEHEALRLEIEELRAKLAATESSKKSMSSLLEGMGIRLG